MGDRNDTPGAHAAPGSAPEHPAIHPALVRWNRVRISFGLRRREIVEAGDALAAALEASEKRADLVTGGLARATAALEASEKARVEAESRARCYALALRKIGSRALEGKTDHWQGELARDALERR